MNFSSALWNPLPERIAVFRALNLGDLLCSMPALRALRQAAPQAHITLVGLESVRSLIERFSAYVDELVLFPGDPAFPEQPVRHQELADFYRGMNARRFDLALQLHGSGQRSNAIVARLGARLWAGFVPEVHQQEAGRLMAWPDDQPEIKRYLSLLTYLGLSAEDADLEFPLTSRDQDEADAVAQAAGLDLDRTIFVHPGARLSSRRWPVERFAQVAAGLAAGGWQLAITGSRAESSLADQLAHLAPVPMANLCGATSLGALASMLQRGRLLISNDTGISHIASAVKLRSVVVACGSDVNRWAPLNADLHTVLYEPMACRPCAHDECPIGHSCALAITAAQVLARAAGQLEKEERHA